MNLIARSIFLLLAAVSAASCASVPPPVTRSVHNPANPAAMEGPVPKLDLFAPVALETRPVSERPPEATMPEMDHSKMGHSMPEATPTPEGPAETYTCVMHPHIAEPRPGNCPICAMPLVKTAKEKQ